MAQGQMNLDQVKGTIEWSGPAAKAYEKTVETQQTAAGLTVTMIQKLQEFLSMAGIKQNRILWFGRLGIG
ncbi:MAG: hypothetical protein Q4G45_13610, partial [Actinomycetia bacterium]|nr:hypothetical protein [Actinomycetes bacterium]